MYAYFIYLYRLTGFKELMPLIYIMFPDLVITFIPFTIAANLKLIPFIRLKINCKLRIIIARVIVASVTRSRGKSALVIISGQKCAVRSNISKRQRATSPLPTLHRGTLRYLPAMRSRKAGISRRMISYLDDALTSPIILVYPVTVSYPYRIVRSGHYARTWSISYGERRKLRRARSRGEKTPVDRGRRIGRLSARNSR